MNPINNLYNKQILPLTQKYPLRQINRVTNSFQDILQLQSQLSTNYLEDYNYTVPIKEVNNLEQNTNDHIVFPPENAPEGVKKAFEALNLSDEEKQDFTVWIIGLTVGVEMLKQEHGIKSSKKIDPYVSTNEQLKSYFSQSGFSYLEMTNNLINTWERSKSFNNPKNYIQRMQVLEKFKAGLIENGVK